MPITVTPYTAVYGPLSVGATCSFWLDGLDPNGTSIQPANGTAVTTWADKSGRGYVATKQTGTIVTSSTGVYFNGTGYLTAPGLAGNLVNTPFVVFCVDSVTGTGAQITFGDLPVNNPGGVYTDNNMNLLYRSQTNFSFSFYNDDLDYTGISGSGVMRLWACYLPSASNRNTRLNGSVIATHTNFTQAKMFVTPSVGAGNGGNYYTGTISEIIVFPSDIGLTAIRQVEGYLAQKWGLTANLPAGHPGLTQTLYTSRAYQSRIPFTITPYSSLNSLTYTGSYITFSVPSGVTSLTFYMWGGGGSGGNNQPGGGGAYLTGILTTTPGETLRIIVGRGGSYGTATYSNAMPDTDGAGGGGGGLAGQGGQGGGRTAIQKYIASAWTEVVTAGGGGSSGGNANTYGGNAYYTGTSQSGGSTYGQGRTPTGGSATAGGLGTFSVNVGTPWDGTQFLGGSASNAFNVSPVTGACGGGGGGGGYYGGGGGGRSGADTYGGGGGGSYYNATYVSNFSGSNGNATTGVATNITGYVTGCGVAGQAGSVYNGSNGLVVLNLAYTKVPLTLTPYISFGTSAASSTNGIYTVLTFAYPGGTLVAMKPITVTYLVIGGGGGGAGGGAAYQTGGGGAGGAVYVSSSTALPAGSYAVTVGVGGSPGQVGGNSVFNGSTGYGGGYGGGWINGAGSSGGCGGGGSGEGGAGGSGTQGFGGGSGRSQNTAGGGGGGMGSAGSTPNGGNGLQYSITGTAIYYAGGGGGNGGGGLGGSGGGGNATLSGTNGLGGGGGGGGGSGGHGTVIISYVFT